MFVEILVKGFLFIYFAFMAIVLPLFDGQIVLPISFFPSVLVDQFSKHAHENNDFLVLEKPDFLVGLIWLELLVQWPLCIANLYGLLTNKSWYKKTCLIYGVSTSTAMVAMLSELIISPKSSTELLSIHGPFLGFALIPILYGLAPHSTNSFGAPRSSKARKKRA